MEINFKNKYLLSAVAVSLLCSFFPYASSGDNLPVQGVGKGILTSTEDDSTPENDSAVKANSTEEVSTQSDTFHLEEAIPNEYSTPITYYSQSDPQWGSYLYGGTDPMASHGCGPTVLAILVSTLTDSALTPPQAAEFAAANGYWAYDSGSAHSLIPEGAGAYGLRSTMLTRKTPDGLRSALTYNRLVVFLMGPGDFTSSGHFIVAFGVNADGSIKIADPARPENLNQSYSAEQILSQISSAQDAGGPIWIISKQ